MGDRRGAGDRRFSAVLGFEGECRQAVKAAFDLRRVIGRRCRTGEERQDQPSRPIHSHRAQILVACAKVACTYCGVRSPPQHFRDGGAKKNAWYAAMTE